MTKQATKALQTLSPLQARYVERYVKTGNSEQSMLEAGYGRGYARGNCSKILAIPCIKAAINALMQPVHSSAERCIEELAAISYSDIGDVMDFDGTRLTMKAFKEMPAAARRAIASVKARIIPSKHKGAPTVTEFEFKMHNKTATLPILANHHKVTNADTPQAAQIHLHFFQPDEAQGILERLAGKGAKRILDVASEK